MVNSVNVKMMSLKWMTRKDKSFLDLVDILDRTSNKTILQTTFMNSLVDAFWGIYSKQIIWKQFIPSMAYQFFMVNFMAFSLIDEEKGDFSILFYDPIIGCNVMFIINQVLTEVVQFRNSKTNWAYFSDIWNLNDLVYLALNITLILANYFSLFELEK